MITNRVSAKELELASRQTPWFSIYVSGVLLCFIGIQNGVYFTSTWQYLSENDPTATVDFLGFVIGLMSLGCAIANPALGYWSQVSGSTKNPVIFAFCVSGVGNFIYGFAYLFDPNAKWIMLFSRFLTGIGPGALGVVRSFIGTASTREDRFRAITLANAGFSAGFFLGPAIQLGFFPLGKDGYSLGPLELNMYTTCAFFVSLLSFCSATLAKLCIDEDYVGIISNEEKTDDPFFVMPKFERLPVILLFYMWWLMCGVVCIESLAAPLTIAMFGWSAEDAVFYNGFLQTFSCIFTTVVNFTVANTRVQFVDQRKLLIFGLLNFFTFFAVHLPWPFYPGPIGRSTEGLLLTNGTNITESLVMEGCIWDWCDYTPRVPIVLYLIVFSVALGLAFPFVSSSTFALLTQILGPRKQSFVQGWFAFTGAFSQFVVSILSTRLFEHSGYKLIMTYHLTIVTLAIIGVFLLWNRLVPLKLLPHQGIATRYKKGTFYRM
ncbi:unnamed protein product [Caenorhabditis auriculariae]|uniref:Major facilitator superfamily (MFS) profile domain-containing protein n=1 Tax=Caenorhabditis auriculariae TaxID=2777116 RepID=A0A8S1H5U3_9PELO|nr:unnamed protein product [Caenorhabditis auriculariae]